MNRIYARDFGIVPGMADCAKAVESLFDTHNSNIEIHFDSGEYLLSHYVNIRNLNNVKVIGNNTVFSVEFDPCHPEDAQGAFRFFDCTDLSLIGIDLTNSKNVNSAGTVIQKDIENLTYIVKLYEGCYMTGDEKMLAVDTLDDENTPDYVMVHYQGDTTYRHLGNGVLEVKLTDDHRNQIANLRIGHKIAIRHGLTGNPAICFYNCKDILVENMRVYSSHSFVIVVYPRSNNITIRKMLVKAPDNSPRLMATNKDAIHIAGCSGTVVLEDSEFINMGDDTLNVHSKAGMVLSANNGTIEAVNIKYEDGVAFGKNVKQAEVLAPWWAKPGDVVDIHDQVTFRKKASLKVKNFENGILILESSANVSPGDVLCNSEFYPKTIIRNVKVRNSRARGFLLQTHDALIENCSLYGIALSGILFAPDAIVWAEAGPSEDVIIRNNTFEKCCQDKGILSKGVISFQESHDSYKKLGYEPIHKRITIDNNIFRNSLNKALNISCAQTIFIRYNEIDMCTDPKYQDKVCICAENVIELQVAINTITDGSHLLTKDVGGSCTYINANPLHRYHTIDIPANDEAQELVYKLTPQRDLTLTYSPPIQHLYERAPLLFMVPGGGWWTEKRASMFEFVDNAVLFLREHGFAVVSIDYRVYSEPNVVMRDIVTDCYDALRYIATFSETLNVDKDRIALISHSAGGHLALMLSLANKEEFKSSYQFEADYTIKSVAALSPLTNLKKTSNTFGFDFSKAFGEKDSDEERLKYSPIAHVSSNAPATFLAAGTSDRVVYSNSSELLFEKLCTVGVPCELILSICGGHVFEEVHKGITPSPAKDEIVLRAAQYILKHT